VRAAAGADDRHLGLVVQLLRAQAVGPHACGVDDAVGPDLERLAASRLAHAHAAGAPGLLQQVDDLEPVGADGPEALGLPQHGEHQAGVVGLAVVEEVAGGRLARGQRGELLADLVAPDDPVPIWAPLGAGAVYAPAAAPAAAALHGHHVVEVEADADEAVGPCAVEGGDDERQRPDQMRGQLDHELALEQGLADEPEVEVLQVAQPAVDQLRRAAGGARREVGLLDQRDAVAARGGVEGDARAGDPPADDDDVEDLLGEGGDGVGAGDHVRCRVPSGSVRTPPVRSPAWPRPTSTSRAGTPSCPRPSACAPRASGRRPAPATSA
jgi:hypothetical protein